MLFKLLLSVAITLPIALQIAGAAEDGLPIVAIALVAIVAGYHRNLLDQDKRLPWLRIPLPRHETMYVRRSIWGVPIEPPRRVRIGQRMRGRTEATPFRAWVVEVLPGLLRAVARRVGA